MVRSEYGMLTTMPAGTAGALSVLRYSSPSWLVPTLLLPDFCAAKIRVAIPVSMVSVLT